MLPHIVSSRKSIRFIFLIAISVIIKKVKILILCGSIAKKSHTRGLLHHIEKLLTEKDIDVVFWDLLSKPLPIALPEFHKDPFQNPNESVREFAKEIISADGFVLGSPLYHGSYSGVLKNALDNLHYNAFKNKPVALISNSSTSRNCAHACEHLRLVVRAIYGYVLQSQIGTCGDDYEEKEDCYELKDEEIKKRTEQMVHELIKFADILKKNPII